MRPVAAASATDRLAAISPRKLRKFDAWPEDGSEWPHLDGVVTIAFTSRVGSTFLCQEIERTFQADAIGETFRDVTLEPMMRANALPGLRAALVHGMTAGSSGGWFVLKTGLQTLIRAEKSGFYDRYRDRARFILLFRRDLLGQAVSIASAKLTGQYHSTQDVAPPPVDPQFDERIALGAIRSIVQAFGGLVDYLAGAAWPTHWLAYEDFSAGRMSDVFAVLDGFGVPRRTRPPPEPPTALEPITRSYAPLWRERLAGLPLAIELGATYSGLLARVERIFPHLGEIPPPRP